MPETKLPTLYTQPGSRWWWYSHYHDGCRDRESCRDLGLHTGIPYDEALHKVCIHLGLIPADPAPEAETLAWFREEILHRLERERKRPGTVKEYRIALDHLVACFGEDFLLRDFHRSDIGRLQDYLLRNDEPPTVNKICRHLRGAFSRLIDDELLDRNPFRKFRKVEESDHKKNLTREETIHFLEVLAAYPQESIRRLIRIYLFTGRRRSEILNLPRSAINLVDWTIRVPNVKARRREEQIIRIHPGIRRSVAWFLDKPRASDSTPVLPEPNAAPAAFPFCICKEDYLSRQVKRLLISAGLGIYTEITADTAKNSQLTKSILKLHSLRHTFGTLARESGVSREDLQAHFGHADIDTTEIYDHFTPLPEIPLGLNFDADNDT